MLEAAQSVFAEKGYARATLDEIAERAEFGKGTLYNYFEGGKEEILYAVFETIYDEIVSIIEQALRGPAHATEAEAAKAEAAKAEAAKAEAAELDAAEQPARRTLRDMYRDLVVRSFTFYTEREDLLIILQKEAYRMAFSDDRERARFFHSQHERIISAVVPAIEAAADADEIQHLSPEAVAHMLVENLNGLLVQRSLSRRAHADLDDCFGSSVLDDPDAAADFLVSMLFDGLSTSSPAPDSGPGDA